MASNLSDQLKIAELIAMYSYTWDEKDLDAYAALFVEDCVWELFQAGEPVPEVRVEGRDALLSAAIEIHSGQGRLAGIQTRLIQSGLVILEQTTVAARTRNMALLVAYPAAEGPKVITTGVYEDSLQKTESGWKFAHRSFRVDGPLE